MSPIANCRLCPLHSLPVFLPHTDAERLSIESFKSGELSVETGGELLAEGVRNTRLFTLRSGWAFRFRTLSDGRRQILNFLLPGDLIGLQQYLGEGLPHGVEAMTACSFCVFPAERLWELFSRHPQIGYDITWLAAHEQLIVDENLLSVGRRSARERLAMLLIHLFKRAEQLQLRQSDSVPFPVTQRHIADALGLSLVHTNKTLRQLERAGLHQISDGRLRLLRPDTLARMADYYALPLRPRPLL